MTFKKIDFDFFAKIYGYKKYDVYWLSFSLGDNLSFFVGEKIFKLLLDSKTLIFSKNKFRTRKTYHLDSTYELHFAAKALEGFLEKIINGKKLKMDKNDTIGMVFGHKNNIVRKKLKKKNISSKVKSTWDFCRNDVMHFQKNESDFDSFDSYSEILKTMKMLFEDLYCKSNPSKDILNKIQKYKPK